MRTSDFTKRHHFSTFALGSLADIANSMSRRKRSASLDLVGMAARSCRDRGASLEEVSFEEAISPGDLTSRGAVAPGSAARLMRRFATAFAGTLIPREARVIRCRIVDFGVPMSVVRPLVLTVASSPVTKDSVLARVQMAGETLTTGEAVIVMDGEFEMVPLGPRIDEEYPR